jgi:hypothetical protein
MEKGKEMEGEGRGRKGGKEEWKRRQYDENLRVCFQFFPLLTIEI